VSSLLIYVVEGVCNNLFYILANGNYLFGFMLSLSGQDKTAFEITIRGYEIFPCPLVLGGN